MPSFILIDHQTGLLYGRVTATDSTAACQRFEASLLGDAYTSTREYAPRATLYGDAVAGYRIYRSDRSLGHMREERLLPALALRVPDSTVLVTTRVEG